MSEDTNQNGEGTTNEGKKGPRVVKHIDERISDLKLDIAERQAKLDALIRERDSSSLVDAIVVGDTISFEFGRAEKKRVESGTVIATDVNEKGVRQFNVLVGSGLNSKTLLIAGSAVVIEGVERTTAAE